MSDLLDASMVVRNLAGDPRELADVSAEVIVSVAARLITNVVIVETA